MFIRIIVGYHEIEQVKTIVISVPHSYFCISPLLDEINCLVECSEAFPTLAKTLCSPKVGHDECRQKLAIWPWQCLLGSICPGYTVYRLDSKTLANRVQPDLAFEFPDRTGPAGPD